MRIVIFVTAASSKEAEKIANRLIEKKLAACVNIIGNVKSIFWWEGKPNTAKEVLLIIKSRKSKLSAIIKQVKSLHSYTVPEIIALPIILGDKDYLKWLDESLG